jgi:hypothetical protein
MGKLNDAEVLDLWERGAGRHSLDRALLALGAFRPEAFAESLADWPLGRRNQALLQMHAENFGHQLRGWAACARCGEKLEFDLDTRMLAGAEADVSNNWEQPVSINGQAFRLPSSRDLARAANEPDVAKGAFRIAESCLCENSSAAAWTEEDLSAIGERMASADPLAETLLDLRCPECGHQSAEPLDLAAFLWTEIEARARRILLAIHTLASAYGWSEAEILSLSDHRRSLYLELAQS